MDETRTAPLRTRRIQSRLNPRAPGYTSCSTAVELEVRGESPGRDWWHRHCPCPNSPIRIEEHARARTGRKRGHRAVARRRSSHAAPRHSRRDIRGPAPNAVQSGTCPGRQGGGGAADWPMGSWLGSWRSPGYWAAIRPRLTNKSSRSRHGST